MATTLPSKHLTVNSALELCHAEIQIHRYMAKKRGRRWRWVAELLEVEILILRHLSADTDTFRCCINCRLPQGKPHIGQQLWLSCLINNNHNWRSTVREIVGNLPENIFNYLEKSVIVLPFKPQSQNVCSSTTNNAKPPLFPPVYGLCLPLFLTWLSPK